MRYDIEKRTFLIKKFHELKNIRKVQKAWRTKFISSKAPDYKTIKNLVDKFEKLGLVENKPRKLVNNVRKREDAKKQLKSLFEEKPGLSIRKASQQVGISYGMTRDILRKDLELKPYKYNECQKLEPSDFPKRLNFANWFIKQPKNNKFFFICSDEAYFYLTESVNKQNNRLWLASRPLNAIERPLYDEKVLVWCAISASKIYGPYFFETPVNSSNYLMMLKSYFWPMFSRTNANIKHYFQQDGAPAHTANEVQNYLKQQFSERFLDKTMWPPRSPDLNPCDFYLWGYLKSVVYNPLPKNLDELKANIKKEIEKIEEETLKKIFLNLEKRCHLVIEANGGFIENKNF